MAAAKSKKRVLQNDLKEKSEVAARPVAEESAKKASSKEPRTLGAIVFGSLGWLLRHIVPRYFITSARELRQVTWPNLKETRQLTTAVIIFAIAVGVVVSLVDFGLDKVFKKVILKQ